MTRSLVACALLLSATSLFGDSLSLHRGVTVDLPAGWRIAATSERERAKNSQDYADPAIAERMNQSAGANESLLIVAKHPAEHVGLNPSIHVSRMPLPSQLAGATPEKVIEVALPVLTRAFHDVRVEEWMPQFAVGDRPAAQATVGYALQGKSGRVTAARASIVVVPDGDGFFIIGYSSPPSGEDDARAVFKEFLATVRFTRPAV